MFRTEAPSARQQRPGRTQGRTGEQQSQLAAAGRQAIEVGHGLLQGRTHQRAEGMAAGDPLELLPWLKLAGQGLEASGIRALLRPSRRVRRRHQVVFLAGLLAGLLRLVPVQAWGLALSLGLLGCHQLGLAKAVERLELGRQPLAVAALGQLDHHAPFGTSG